MLSIALANITVLADLLIIVVFSRILGKNLTSTNFVVDFLLNNIYIYRKNKYPVISFTDYAEFERLYN